MTSTMSKIVRRFRKGDHSDATATDSTAAALNEATKEGQIIVQVTEGNDQPISYYEMQQNLNSEKLREVLRLKSYMRTKTLVFIDRFAGSDTTEASHRWLEAQYTGNNEWSLRLVKSAIDIPQTAASFTLASGLSNQKLQKAPENKQFETLSLDTGLTTQEILTKMASFDPFFILSGDATYAAHQEVNEGSPHYYRNQGLIRGFAFEEEHGMPVETLGGQINSSGIFSAAQRMMVEQAWLISKSRNPIENLFDTVIDRTKTYEKEWADILKELREASVIAELHSGFRALLNAYKECTDYKFEYTSDINSFTSSLKKFRQLASKHSGNDFVRKTADIIETSFKINLFTAKGKSTLNEKLTPDGLLELEKMVDEFYRLTCEFGAEVSKEQIAASIVSGRKSKIGVPDFLWKVEHALKKAADEAKSNALEFSEKPSLGRARPLGYG